MTRGFLAGGFLAAGFLPKSATVATGCVVGGRGRRRVRDGVGSRTWVHRVENIWKVADSSSGRMCPSRDGLGAHDPRRRRRIRRETHVRGRVSPRTIPPRVIRRQSQPRRRGCRLSDYRPSNSVPLVRVSCALTLEEALAAVALTERAWPTIAVRKVIAADMFAELLR